MKWVKYIFAAILLLIASETFAQVAPGNSHTNDFIQGACGGTVTMGSVNITGGGLVVVMLQGNGGGIIPRIASISDNNGGTWGGAPDSFGNTPSCPGTQYPSSQIWHSFAHPTGATVVSVVIATQSGPCNGVLQVQDFTGLSNATLDCPSNGAGTGGGSSTTIGPTNTCNP